MALLDELMANAWPPAVVERCGDWRLRRTGGRSRRANSALAIGGDRCLAELVAHVEAFYRGHDARPRFQLSTASAPPGLAPLLHERGFADSARTLVCVARTSDVLRRCEPSVHQTRTEDTATDDWFDTYWSVESARGASALDALVYRTILLTPALETVFVTAGDGPAVAVGQLVVEGDFAGIQCMATRPAARRRGRARAVLRTLAREASDRGIEHLYLAVMADNHAARRLYDRAGFTRSHEYSYLTAAAPGP